MIRLATAEEIENWDELVKANPDGGNVLQSRAFADTKQKFGWEPVYAVYSLASGQVAVLYLKRSIRALGELIYAPKGPGITDPAALAEILADTKPPAFAIKVEPEIVKTQANIKALKQHGLVKVRDIQFNYATIVVDLTPDEDAIINSFRQKTRYNIRLAERKEVKVEAVESTDANLKIMYDLMQQTGQRAGVFVRGYDYFSCFWKLHSQRGCGQLFFARHDGQVLAAAYITYLGHKALYKDGGSTREHSNLQAPYLLQWQVMRWLKAHGVTEYDLHGVPGADESSPDHPRAGLAQFKSGFNETVTEYVGTWDWPIDAAGYRRWQKWGERLTAGYWYRIKKQLFY